MYLSFILNLNVVLKKKNNFNIECVLYVFLMWFKCLFKCVLNIYLKVGRIMRGFFLVLGIVGFIKVCDLIKFSMGFEI